MNKIGRPFLCVLSWTSAFALIWLLVLDYLSFTWGILGLIILFAMLGLGTLD